MKKQLTVVGILIYFLIACLSAPAQNSTNDSTKTKQSLALRKADPTF